MIAQGEAIYKAKARIEKYGVKAFVDMLGEKAIKKRGGRPRLLKYYTEKYPTAPITLEPKAPYISRSQRSYWKDVKALSDARDMPIKETRKLLKRLKTDRNVQVRVIKSGEGWQLIMLGLYENTDKDDIYFKQREESLGHSFVNRTEMNYDDALEECIKEAQAKLGGSGWKLVKILKETWIRYYGREI
jgi:parvulin-like peptidyl-prolyl isomerase